jgi:hypothetical protein
VEDEQGRSVDYDDIGDEEPIGSLVDAMEWLGIGF